MNVLFFEITPTGLTSPESPIGSNPKIEYVDLYTDSSINSSNMAAMHLQPFSYNEETKELLIWENGNSVVPA